MNPWLKAVCSVPINTNILFVCCFQGLLTAGSIAVSERSRKMLAGAVGGRACETFAATFTPYTAEARDRHFAHCPGSPAPITAGDTRGEPSGGRGEGEWRLGRVEALSPKLRPREGSEGRRGGRRGCGRPWRAAGGAAVPMRRGVTPQAVAVPGRAAWWAWSRAASVAPCFRKRLWFYFPP